MTNKLTRTMTPRFQRHIRNWIWNESWFNLPDESFHRFRQVRRSQRCLQATNKGTSSKVIQCTVQN